MPKIQLGNHKVCLYDQGTQHECGIAAIRAILKTQYNLSVPRERVVSIVCDFYKNRLKCSKKEAEKYFKTNGTSPSSIAHSLRKLSRLKLKVFCSKKGNLNRLNHLFQRQYFPIIHTEVSYYEGDKPGGHYLSFLGRKNKQVRLFDPAPEEGLKRMTPQKFKRMWYNPTLSETWFLVSLTENEKLGLVGKYI